MKNNHAKSFVVTMIIIALLALLLRFALEKVIAANIERNDSTAALTLKLISSALENYAKDKAGVFSANLSVLTQTSPVYLDKDYIQLSPLKGYHYSCSRLEASGYNCSAVPVKCGFSGKMVYTVSTGNLFISEKCVK